MTVTAPTRAVTLSAHDLTVVYGSLTALHPLSLNLTGGALLAVTGPSGAGKTSLLWALAGANPAGSGTVHVDDTPIRGYEDAVAAGVHLLPHGNALADSLTATENITLPLIAAGTPPAEGAARAAAALTAVGLHESGNHLIEELSGGQQQRVAVARAIAFRPAVLLADEPTSDVDPSNRQRILALLRDHAHTGAIVILTTNDPDAAAVAHAELALDNGKSTRHDHHSGDRAVPPQAGLA